MRVRGVVHDQVDDDAHVALVRLGDELAELVERAELGEDPLVVGDVVAAVAQRRGEERRKPQPVDAEPLQVVELADQPAEVAGAVAVRVDERAHHDLVEHRSSVPLRVEGQTGQRDGSGEGHPSSLGEGAQPPAHTIAGVTVPTPHADALARIPVREARSTVLGSTTRYWEYGPADAAHTVVIAHGYRGDHHGLEPVIALLPEVRFVSPDLPGFGVSTPMTEAPHSIAGLRALARRVPRRARAARTPCCSGTRSDRWSPPTRSLTACATPALILINPISTDPHQGGGARHERPHPRVLRHRAQAARAPRPRRCSATGSSCRS